MHFTAKRITYFLQKVKKIWDREGIIGHSPGYLNFTN